MISRRLVLLLFLMLAIAVLPARAATDERLFPETGWRVRGRLLQFWDANGGLPIFGLPLGPQSEARSGAFAAQIFERERLEIHPELRAPYDVLLGRLGAELLERAGRDWRREGDGQQPDGPCQHFAQTDRAICGAFRAYWRGHGLELGDRQISERESLALFGLPLTAPKLETNSSGDRVLTQWFERARFELHDEGQSLVVLGRLGAEWVGPDAAPLPPVEVVLDPRAVIQGHTTTASVEIDGATAVRATLSAATSPFVQTPDGWRTLLGVPVLTKPGPLKLRLEADLRDGRTVVRDVTIQVLDARYPRERINLPKEVTDRLERNQEAIRKERALVNQFWTQVTPERLWSGRFMLPAQGRISSHFGTLRSYNGGPYDSFHEGLDIANATGTPIVAPARGRVVLAEPDLLVRGGAVILDHGWGVHTAFWHQSAILVKVGDVVEQGQIIGRIGAKGMVTGPHLHWDVRLGSVNVSPLEWTERAWQ